MTAYRVLTSLIFILFLFASFVGYADDAPPSAFHPEKAEEYWSPPELSPTKGEYKVPVAAIEEQPLEMRIAQLMLITLEGGQKPSVQDISFLDQYFPGGVMFRHSPKRADIISIVNLLHTLEQNQPLPLLLGTDLYRVDANLRTVPSEFIQLPTLLALTAAGSPNLVKDTGELMALYLQFMGLNFHFGPALELAPSLQGAPDTLNTFGSNPQYAAESGTLLYKALQERAILLLPSGFPGGGANRIGRGAAVLTTPENILLENDGFPYKKLIDEGAPMIHVGNVIAPTLDIDNRPASMSPAVITTLLRGSLQFDGVVVAGPMDDEVLQGRYDPAEAAVQALLAGADILYWQGSLVQVMRSIAAIEYAVKAGLLDEARINESLQRIKKLKANFPTTTKAISEQKADSQLNKKKLQEISQNVERHAITLLKNEPKVLPLVKKVSTPVGITGVVGVEELFELLEKELKPVVRQRITTARHIGDVQRFEIERLTKNMRGLRTIICILSDKARPETQVELVRALKSSAQHVVVIYLGHPRHATKFTMADAVVLAYCDAANLGQSIQALADILMGKAPVSILPVDTPLRLKAGEKRTFNALEIIQAPSGRLPIHLSEQYPAGTAARYNPAASIKHVEWDFGGNKSKKENVVRSFDKAGETLITLTVTDYSNEVSQRSFSVVTE
ncbi:MAG: glycoside hydrolase family 3 N-terminal domain-containing protein [Candidatus Hydrogenedentales bacterium]